MRILASAIGFAGVFCLFCVPVHSQAVRVINGNACGSGSVCGFRVDPPGAYILTNAHVAGTSIGRVVSLDFDSPTGRSRVDGRVVMAAYSDRVLTDWAIVETGGIRDGVRWRLSRELPTDGRHLTCGSPRCVWPLVCGEVRTRSSDLGGPWLWEPNSIGGQSGSSVRSPAGVTYGVLTWSWGGSGAGQRTRDIYRQAVGGVVDAAARPAGLIEVSSPRAETAVGFFAQAGIRDLPIWDGGGGVPPPVDPPCECERVASLRAAVERAGFDWGEFLKLVLLLIEFFAKR